MQISVNIFSLNHAFIKIKRKKQSRIQFNEKFMLRVRIVYVIGAIN